LRLESTVLETITGPDRNRGSPRQTGHDATAGVTVKQLGRFAEIGTQMKRLERL